MRSQVPVLACDRFLFFDGLFRVTSGIVSDYLYFQISASSASLLTCSETTAVNAHTVKLKREYSSRRPLYMDIKNGTELLFVVMFFFLPL